MKLSKLLFLGFFGQLGTVACKDAQWNYKKGQEGQSAREQLPQSDFKSKNLEPNLSAKANPNPAYEGDLVNFEAECSYDKITWNLGQGIIKAGSKVQQTFKVRGTYTIKVTCESSQGGLSPLTKDFSLEVRAPSTLDSQNANQSAAQN